MVIFTICKTLLVKISIREIFNPQNFPYGDTNSPFMQAMQLKEQTSVYFNVPFILLIIAGRNANGDLIRIVSAIEATAPKLAALKHQKAVVSL